MTSYTLWAPAATDLVEVAVEDQRLPMTRGEGGWWHLETDAVAADAPYGYCLDGGDPRPDPRGRRLVDGPHGLANEIGSGIPDQREHVVAGAVRQRTADQPDERLARSEPRLPPDGGQPLG